MNRRTWRTNKKLRTLLVALGAAAGACSSAFALATPAQLVVAPAASDAPAACDTSAIASSFEAAYDDKLGAFEVDSVTVSGIGSDCTGAVIRVGFTNATGGVLGSARSAKIAATETGTQVLEFATANVSAEDVAGISVVVDAA